MFRQIDSKFRGALNQRGVTTLRICLAIVFLWFGALKVTGHSPVEDLITSSFSSLPFEFPFTYLGVLEILIGLGLLFKIALRLTLGAMWLMLLGTFSTLIINPDIFFSGNVFYLTTEGEFVIKNLVLLSAGAVIASQVE